MPKNGFTCDCHMLHADVVEAVQQAMPTEAQMQRLAEFYKVMGDPTRCKLIFALQQQEMCVCDLANLLSMTKSAVSHQLAKMRESGIVRWKREGKSVIYGLDDAHVSQMFAVTMEHIRHLEEESKHEA